MGLLQFPETFVFQSHYRLVTLSSNKTETFSTPYCSVLAPKEGPSSLGLGYIFGASGEQLNHFCQA